MKKVLLIAVLFLSSLTGSFSAHAACAITGISAMFTGATNPSLGVSGGASSGTWSSSNPAIASVNPTTGVITGIHFGTCNIIFTGTTACGTVTLTKAFTVRCNPSFVATATADGTTITVSAAGGSGSYTGTGTFTVAGAGTYNYTVTDETSGCSSTASVTVTCTMPSVTLSATNVTCNGMANGSITSTAVGEDLTYNWDNGSTDASISGLAPGTYTLTVSNSCGSASASATIEEPTPVVAMISPALSCLTTGYGATYVTLTATGSGGTGTVMGSTMTVSPVTTSTACVDNLYTLTVTDANGCSADATANVKTRDVRCYTPSGVQKVNICHKAAKKTMTLCIDALDVADHLAHGDALGTCGTTSCCTSSFARVTNEIAEVAAEFSVFPNPASSLLTVTLPYSTNAIQIALKDLTGRVIMEKSTLEITSVEFNIATVPAGMYIIYSTVDGVGYTQKFVKN